MAQAFLNQLLKIENSVQSDDHQRCLICVEEIGSLSSETGIIECQIRLPCNHLVGSHCIANWLHEKNTCPVCRSAFFPAQPRPHLEHEFMQDVENSSDASDDDSGDDEDHQEAHNHQDDHDHLETHTEWSAHQLRLNYAGCSISQLIARRVIHMDALRDCSRLSKTAVSLFIASHLVRQPVTLERVSTVMLIPQRTTLRAYRLFYPERETVIDGECLYLLREDPQRATVRPLPSLAWPPLEHDEEWSTDAFWQPIAFRLGTRNEATLTLMEISRALAPRLMHRTYLDANRTMDIAALCIYIASCMRGAPLSCGAVASATGVSEGEIRTIYALFYPHREDLLEHGTVIRIRSQGGLERTLDLSPREVPPPAE